MNELKTRVISAVVFAIIFLASMLYSPLTYIIFFGLMIFGSAREFHRLHHIYSGTPVTRMGTAISATIALLPFIATCYAEYYIESHLWEIIPIIISVIIVIILSIDIYRLKSPLLLRMPFWLALIIYPSFLVSVITMTIFSENQVYLKELVLVIIICTWAVDVGAYFIGKKFGKRKLAPIISPNKTIEGAIGGIVSAGLVGVGLSLMVDISIIFGLILGLSCGIGGIFGDLMESKMKRAAGVKDSGSFIPGHGGFLDRFDAFTFNLPVASLIIYIFLHL